MKILILARCITRNVLYSLLGRQPSTTSGEQNWKESHSDYKLHNLKKDIMDHLPFFWLCYVSFRGIWLFQNVKSIQGSHWEGWSGVGDVWESAQCLKDTTLLVKFFFIYKKKSLDELCLPSLFFFKNETPFFFKNETPFGHVWRKIYIVGYSTSVVLLSELVQFQPKKKNWKLIKNMQVKIGNPKLSNTGPF